MFNNFIKINKINKRGFTLIELIISIGILSVLVTSFLWVFANSARLENKTETQIQALNYLQYYSESFLNSNDFTNNEISSGLSKTITWTGTDDNRNGTVDEGNGYKTVINMEKIDIAYSHEVDFPGEDAYEVTSDEVSLPEYVNVASEIQYDATYYIFYNGNTSTIYQSSTNPLQVNIGVANKKNGKNKNRTKYIQFFDQIQRDPILNVESWSNGWKNHRNYWYSSPEIFSSGKDTFNIKVEITPNALSTLQDNKADFYIDSNIPDKEVRYFFPEELINIEGTSYTTPKHIKFWLYGQPGHSSYTGDRMFNHGDNPDSSGGGSGEGEGLVNFKLTPYKITIDSYYNDQLIDSTEVVKYFRES
jgi:prepilin-type N-terminal cleavage/methylation domain-containing protein